MDNFLDVKTSTFKNLSYPLVFKNTCDRIPNMNKESFDRYSKASKARWARFTPEERTEKMRLVALTKWSNMSDEDKRAHAYKMLAGKNKDDNK